MRALELARRFSEESKDAELQRWSRSIQRSIARDVVYLASFVHHIPEETLPSYWETLEEVLDVIPDGMAIEVSKVLRDTLLSEAPDDANTLRTLIEEKTIIANP